MNPAALRDELRSLDWRRPEQWTRAMRRMLAGGAALLLTVLLWVSLLAPALAERTRVEQQQRVLQQQLLDLQHQIAPLAAAAVQQAALRDLHAAIWRQYDPQGSSLSLLEPLAVLRLRHGLDDEGYEPQADVEQASYQVSQITLHMRGTYPAFAAFISDLAALPQLVVVREMALDRLDKVASAAGAQLSIALTLNHYRPRELSPATKDSLEPRE